MAVEPAAHVDNQHVVDSACCDLHGKPLTLRSKSAAFVCQAAIPSTGAKGGRPRIMSAAFSAIIIVVAYVLAEGMLGIIEASATRSPSIPCTRSWSSTTAVGSVAGPI